MRLRSTVYFLLVLMIGLILSGCTSEATDPVVSTPDATADAAAVSTDPAIVVEVEDTSDEAPATAEVIADREVIALINGEPAYSDKFEEGKRCSSQSICANLRTVWNGHRHTLGRCRRTCI